MSNPLPSLPPGSGIIAAIMQIILWLIRLRQWFNDWLHKANEAPVEEDMPPEADIPPSG